MNQPGKFTSAYSPKVVEKRQREHAAGEGQTEEAQISAQLDMVWGLGEWIWGCWEYPRMTVRDLEILGYSRNLDFG